MDAAGEAAEPRPPWLRGYAHVRAPRHLADAVRALGRWVRSPSFRAKRFSRGDAYDAMREASRLRDELLWLRLRAWQRSKDESHMGAALEWVQSDAAQVEAELLETVARSVKRRPREAPSAYVRRLRDVRRSFGRPARLPTTAPGE